MRDSTIIYRSFYEAIKDLPADNQAEVWAAIFEYALNFKQLELNGISATVFKLIKPQLDANIKRYNNGKKPKSNQNVSKTEAKLKQKVSEVEANKNVNENANENLNANENYKAVFTKQLLESETDIEAIQVSTRIKVTPEILKQYCAHLTTEGKEHHHYNEFKKHLRNWLTKRPEPNQQQNRPFNPEPPKYKKL